MNKSVRGWLLEFSPQPIALAPCEVIEVVDEPEIHRVPVGPPWCRALLFWRNRLIPLAHGAQFDTGGHSIVVVAYQHAPATPLEYAALAVRDIPKQIEVAHDADCAPPEACFLHSEQLRACFVYQSRTVLVPELSALFARRADAA